jgi:ubiquinone/menaquinone biosynthesis C-methylase UbiE
MTRCSSGALHHAGLAFDSIAEQYDDVFTRSLIGRAQRDAVWDVLRQTFSMGERVLELNCGTGEDALFLSRMGVSVVACDASERMIDVAARRMAIMSVGAPVQLEALPTERIGELVDRGPFDGALSNFSGLNCVADLSDTAQQLARIVRAGARMVLVLSTRFCLWESMWYLAQAEPARAVRRWKGHVTASLGEATVEVRSPTMRDINRMFRPFFTLRSRKGIGVTVPPSYVEHLASKHPGVLKKLQVVDHAIASLPGCRSIGDHVLLVLERTEA